LLLTNDGDEDLTGEGHDGSFARWSSFELSIWDGFQKLLQHKQSIDT
jgi:hypothetical protein